MQSHNPLVSIIIPAYNAEAYIEGTLNSVKNQSYGNWELLIVDDCSTDGSAEIIKEYSEKDSRIKYFRTESRSGSPAVPRNIGIENARGRYVAFLDSDDLWLPEKLEKQIRVFQENADAAIVFSYYEKISEEGVRSDRVVTSPELITYDRLLYSNVIGCLTGIYDTEKVGKIYMRRIGHEDYAMWLEILKKGFVGVNTCDVQALRRVRSGSVSADKFKAALWQWNIYRNIECLSIFKAVCCFVVYAFKGIIKSMK